MKRLLLLGASGSIGMQTIDVVLQHPDRFEITALGIGHNISALKEKILPRVHVTNISVAEEKDAAQLSREYPHIRFVYGEKGMEQLARSSTYDVLVNALVGFAGFMPTLAAIETRHNVALANKETLVCGGALIKKALQKYHCELYPIDSEHSAVWQALRGNEHKSVEKLLITCSGGSFRTRTREELKNVTVEEALAHPNWSMGAKITIDSADLMNKGFEVTEAHWLFDIDYDHIEVLMHPQSVVHSAVQYVDHSIIAQMGPADMRLPIQYALTYPERLEMDLKPFDLTECGPLEFYKPDTKRFPLLGLAYEAGKRGGNLDAVMNAANEAANLAFRKKQIPFLSIEDIVISAVHDAPYNEMESVQELIDADAWGREYAERMIKKITG